MTRSSTRLHPSTLRKRSPSWPAMPDRGGADRQVLRRDHLPEHAAGGVRRREQRRVEARLLGRGHLQRAEQRVRRRVRAGDRDAEPADDRRQEGEDAARAGDPEAERDRLAGQVHHVGEREHGGDGQRRPLELVERRAVDAQRARRARAQRRAWSAARRRAAACRPRWRQLNLNVGAVGASPSGVEDVRARASRTRASARRQESP